MTGNAQPPSPLWEWDRYWQANRVAACLEDRDGTYGEAIARVWRSFAEALPGGARVLDIGTGNGAAALEVVRANAEVGVDAADLASIDPPAFVPRFREALARVRFHPRTDMTALPFAAGVFHAVISQYAMEYAPLPAVLAEVERVLLPGGRLHGVVHAREGVPAQEALVERGDAAFLLAPAGLCDLVESALRAFKGAPAGGDAPAATQAPSADQAAAAFRQALAEARQRNQTVMITNVTSILDDLFDARSSAPLEDMLAYLANVRAEIDAHRRRVDALVAAALSREDVQALIADRAPHGLAFSDPAAVHGAGGSLIGWQLDARRTE